MQNNYKYFNQNSSNIINIESERLFREAEDCFLYFNQIKKAINKLNKAIELSPYHYKSLVLKGDICFINGKIDEALDLYKTAEKSCPDNSKILGAIATCFESKGNFEKALNYCDKAFPFVNENNSQLYFSLYELKISILLKLKKYEHAKMLINNANNHLLFDDIKALKLNCQKTINKKLKIKNKLKHLNIKVI